MKPVLSQQDLSQTIAIVMIQIPPSIQMPQMCFLIVTQATMAAQVLMQMVTDLSRVLIRYRIDAFFAWPVSDGSKGWAGTVSAAPPVVPAKKGLVSHRDGKRDEEKIDRVPGE